MGSILSHGSRVGPKSRFASPTSPEITESVNRSVRSSSSVTCSTTYSSYPSAAAASSAPPPPAPAPRRPRVRDPLLPLLQQRCRLDDVLLVPVRRRRELGAPADRHGPRRLLR